MCLLLIRSWSPGAGDNSFNDLRYIWGGFAYLQDMMDHGIIRTQTSKNETLGVFAQQMPYPCFVDDAWVQKLLFVSLVIRKRGRRYYINNIVLTQGSCHSLPPHKLSYGLICHLGAPDFPVETLRCFLLFVFPFLYICVAPLLCFMLSLIIDVGTKATPLILSVWKKSIIKMWHPSGYI